MGEEDERRRSLHVRARRHVRKGARRRRLHPQAHHSRLERRGVGADPIKPPRRSRTERAGRLHGVSHDLVERWHAGRATIVEARVTYTRADDSTLTVPVVTIYRASGELIDDYRIFIDLAPLFRS